MERRRLSTFLIVSCIVFASFSVLLARSRVLAEAGLNLPSEVVTIEVSDGTVSYFDTELSNVPSGYDVANRVYQGWCVDVRTIMARSPATHEVKLYSSLAAPGELAGEKWDMVNYILNHKQGEALDVQQAIWHFVHMDGDGFTPTREGAWVIINDTLANGEGFVPSVGQTVAVICYPMIVFPGQPDVQISIIESAITVVPEFPSALAIGLAVLTMSAIILVRRRIWKPWAKGLRPTI